MANHSRYSVVLTYAEDRRMLTVHAVDPAEVAPLVTGKLEMPILLDDFDYQIDDEFARRLGVAMLNVLALGQPEIKNYMKVTAGPASTD
ncbi:hypothetical protein [Burkholderia plantarii]|uniref:Uncharacterized protein n=1 Tax=Burkholderia plantarii TaxID=41899 RepID=A0A0B6S689_BURPL|nr:hypothetical protein [Burkholderia plantarii]AJK49929.1 hypothetical protein BGL_2c18630 [Burkholderia plantarii]ALK34133.1 hypothetical protein bpln_2g19150 [Burkholderia plantarii]